MAANLLSCNYEDEDFIDMEVSSSTHANSPSKSIEFEFQMASSNVHSNSPADELFYKGKLLPLYLPPRVQMVKSLLQNSKFKQIEKQQDQEQEFITFSTPMVQSCNISPLESCRVSTELTPDEYFFEWSTELTGFIGDHPKKYYGPWSKKLRLIKHSSITQKFKASRSYLKSLFNKSSCGNSDGNSCVKQDFEQDCDNNFLKKYLKVTKKNGFGQLQTGKYPTLANVLMSIEEQGNEDVFDSNCSHRKSFSGAIKRKCSASLTSSSSSSSSSSCSSASASGSSSSSSSFSYCNNLIYELKRNSSADSELEGSIEAAIDHCKKSHQLFNPRNQVFSKSTL